MACTWDDVVALGRELPGVEESTWYRTPALKAGGKGFARLRAESDGGVMLRCPMSEKEALLASGDPAFYTTPHYDGSASILVDLDAVDRERLAELIDGAWCEAAPAALRERRE